MNTVEVHREPFVYLADLAHDRARVAWGAFWFTREGPTERWEIVDVRDDGALQPMSALTPRDGVRYPPYVLRA